MKLEWYADYLEKVEEAILCQWQNGRDIIFYESIDTIKYWKEDFYSIEVFDRLGVEFVNKFDLFMDNIKMKLLSQNTKLNFKITNVEYNCCCILKLSFFVF